MISSKCVFKAYSSNFKFWPHLHLSRILPHAIVIQDYVVNHCCTRYKRARLPHFRPPLWSSLAHTSILQESSHCTNIRTTRNFRCLNSKYYYDMLFVLNICELKTHAFENSSHWVESSTTSLTVRDISILDLRDIMVMLRPMNEGWFENACVFSASLLCRWIFSSY